MDEGKIWSEDQNVILEVFSDEFCKILKKDPNINIRQIPLPRDVSSLGNERLTRKVTYDEILQAVKQKSSLNAP